VKWYNYRKKNPRILLNDENLKPEWVEHPAKYTEFHIIKNSDILLINIGESWTYGESLPNIATGLQKYNFETQLQYTFGPLMSNNLNCDYYQYAVPGNCNGYMYEELPRIIEYIQTNFNYKKIYLLCQLTEPSREQAALNNLPSSHPIHEMYFRKDFGKIDFFDWLKIYDKIFLNIIQETICSYKNVETVVWKNFCKFHCRKKYKKLKIINENWIAFSAKTLNQDYTMLSFQSVGWLHDIMQQDSQNKIYFDIEKINREIDLVEKSNEFIKGNELHGNHPTALGHKLWAENLLQKTGWNNE